jgi:hypothetical protein
MTHLAIPSASFFEELFAFRKQYFSFIARKKSWGGVLVSPNNVFSSINPDGSSKMSILFNIAKKAPPVKEKGIPHFVISFPLDV